MFMECIVFRNMSLCFEIVSVDIDLKMKGLVDLRQSLKHAGIHIVTQNRQHLFVGLPFATYL